MPIDLNQIAAQIRAEGYEEGYAACLREMEAYLSGKKKMPAPASSMKDADIAQQNAKRAPRGQTRKWVQNLLQGGSTALTVKQIQEMLELVEGGVPYSSIQNALAQMERDGEVELVGRGLWMLKRAAAPPITEEAAVSAALAFD